ncbi:MAG TPA: peptide deformylase [Candidatus Pristimantibacillus sp.]|jgi:peptide deformylase|nr:peptide deformylase [Candidatus Pristimantibacillus sp.]
MPASKPSALLLPPDLYDVTAGDKRRTAQEKLLGMLPPQSPQLSQPVPPVDPKLIPAPVIQSVIQKLLIASGSQRQNSQERKTHRMLVGLAAPQLGEPYRIILIDERVTSARTHGGRLTCLINPKVVWRSRETEEGREGCFSAGPVWGLVRRPVAVKVRALTPSGDKIERVFEGFTARIVQHEIDHLDGIRFPDRIRSDRKRHWVHAEEIPVYPENIQHWPRLCSKDRWKRYISG